jgi:hypothetical protein
VAEYAAGRLIRLSELYAEFTEDVLRRAGLKSGMRVFDVDCEGGLNASVYLIPARRARPSILKRKSSSSQMNWISGLQAPVSVISLSRSARASLS